MHLTNINQLPSGRGMAADRWQHDRPGNARKLGAYDRESQGTSKACVWKRPLSSAKGAICTDLYRSHHLVVQQANPPNAEMISNRLAYLQHYALYMAYIATPRPDETPRHFIGCLYNTLQQLAAAGRDTLKMSVVQKIPTIDWERVWRNLDASRVSGEIKSARYSVIHEIFPTNERLAAFHLVDTDICRQCERPDNLTHRLTERVDGTAIWNSARRRVAMMLRTDPRLVSTEWILRPHFHFWPPQRQRAILWTLAHLFW